MRISKPLTRTGAGVLISDIQPRDSFEVEFVEDLIAKYKFIIFKHFLPEVDTDKVKRWLGRHGELVKNEKRADGNALILDGSDKKEVLKGKGRMPLHCDGLLMNESIRLVCIYGIEFGMSEGGRTFISDNEAAWDRIPDKIREAFGSKGIEVMPCDTNYYLRNEPVWYRFPGLQSKGGTQLINGGLHYHKDEQASYIVRIADIPEETSYEYFNTLESIYLDDSMTYYHDWEPGDMLLMDNFRTMHGREAFTGHRSIIQFQVRN